jgi:VWFA-related protein
MRVDLSHLPATLKLLGLFLGALAPVGTPQNNPAVPEVRVSAHPYTPSAPTIKVQSDLVEIEVVVRDHQGRPVAGLRKEDFYILDRRKPQEITNFTLETHETPANTTVPAAGSSVPSTAPASPSPANAPPQNRFIALYFDDLNIDTRDLKHARDAAHNFINQGLNAGDRMAVFTSSGDALDFTGDKPALVKAIEAVRSHRRFSDLGQGMCPRITPYQAYQIAVVFDPAAVDAAKAEAQLCSGADPSSVYARSKIPAADVALQMVKEQAEQTWGQVRVSS